MQRRLIGRVDVVASVVTYCKLFRRRQLWVTNCIFVTCDLKQIDFSPLEISLSLKILILKVQKTFSCEWLWSKFTRFYYAMHVSDRIRRIWISIISHEKSRLWNSFNPERFYRPKTLKLKTRCEWWKMSNVQTWTSRRQQMTTSTGREYESCRILRLVVKSKTKFSHMENRNPKSSRQSFKSIHLLSVRSAIKPRLTGSSRQ